ncbi:xanthine dehydrogenase accessory protein XdhC [Vibrio rhizosphaerae]|uniref:Xanthine dehydrogenase accessory protein XdhC n=1 Tax=Vibrio rhizosphaerae TaxID=398736 RepID=A0ABU4J0S6_9VIBR|nr:xanthine dehydrogenase accessory protein XdhC [Vibrio rhizosphaerae]MDW6094114.1 xanthine dehydrogenase accessory protein XdhC [Vibrio rhizosphaerae]
MTVLTTVHTSINTAMHWLDACHMLQQQGNDYCLATLVATVGSTPRACGAKMVITKLGQYDSLGGGNLEQQVIETARIELQRRCQQSSQEATISIERYSLTADLQQCCGGAVQVLFEYFNTNQPHVAILGAGHIGQALAPMINKLQCHLTVFDSRPHWLAPLDGQGISTQCFDSAETVIQALLPQTHLVIMTHDHHLDYDLTRLALERQCFPYIGLIGSEGKRQRFTYRLNEQLSQSELVSQLTCPIGHPDIKGKRPMQVALSIAAQLNVLFEQRQAPVQPSVTIEPTLANSGQEQPQRLWQQANMLHKNASKSPQ